jgi:hypothetical protein
MNTRVPEEPRAIAVRFTEFRFVVELADGREIGVPLEWFARLRDARPEQRQNYELMGDGAGIHWPDIDEDLSVARLLAPPPRRTVERTARPGFRAVPVGQGKTMAMRIIVAGGAETPIGTLTTATPVETAGPPDTVDAHINGSMARS